MGESYSTRSGHFLKVAVPWSGEIARKLGLGFLQRVERRVGSHRFARPQHHGVKALHPGPFRHFVGAALGRRHYQSPAPVLSRYAIVAMPGPTVIWHVSSLPQRQQRRAVIRWRRAGARRAGGASTAERANTGSDDRSCDLAADCGGTSCQTPWPDRPHARQVANVDALKAASAEFAAIRPQAINFQGLIAQWERRRGWMLGSSTHARLGSTRCSVLRGRYARTWRLFGMLCWNPNSTGRSYGGNWVTV